MGRVKELQMNLNEAVEIFGEFQHEFSIETNKTDIQVGDTVILVNNNCQFDFDNCYGSFEKNNLQYEYIVDLELVGTDYSNYVPLKSNNGGCYAFGEFKVVKIHNMIKMGD